MTSLPATQYARCTTCGATLTSRFCGDCGTPAAGADQSNAVSSEGWRAIASDLFPEERNGFFSVLMSFARHPVDTIIRLTEDPNYRSHWGFMTACLGAQLTLTYLVLPRLLSLMFGVPHVNNNPSVPTSELVQYVGIFIMLPVQYYLCRAAGTIERSPRSYAKLCALSVGYSAALSAALFVVFFAALSVIVKFALPVGYVEIGTATSAINVLAILVFVSWTHKIYWGMRWSVAVGVTFAIALLSWAVVYPGLGILAQQSGISTLIDNLFA